MNNKIMIWYNVGSIYLWKWGNFAGSVEGTINTALDMGYHDSN